MDTSRQRRRPGRYICSEKSHQVDDERKTKVRVANCPLQPRPLLLAPADSADNIIAEASQMTVAHRTRDAPVKK